MGITEYVPSVVKVFWSSRKRKPAPTPAGEQDTEEAANDSPAKRVKPTTGGQQTQAVDEGLQRASTAQDPLPAKESKQDDGLEALKLLQPFKPSPQNPANNLFKAFEVPACMPLAALSRGCNSLKQEQARFQPLQDQQLQLRLVQGNQPRGFTNNSLRARTYTNRDGKRTSLQAKQQLQQPSYLEKRVPGWQTGSQGTSNTHIRSVHRNSSSSSRRLVALGLAIPAAAVDPVKQRLLFDNVTSSAGKAAAGGGYGDVGGDTSQPWVNSSGLGHARASSATEAAAGIRVRPPTIAEAIFGTAAGASSGLTAPMIRSQQLQDHVQQPWLETGRQGQQQEQWEQQQQQRGAAPYVSPEATTFMAAITWTAQHVGLDVQQVAGVSPSLTQAATPAATAEAYRSEQLAQEVDVLQSSFAKHLEKEKKFMAHMDQVVLDNQRVLLSFSQDYQINEASQGARALQQQAAQIQQQRLEQHHQLLQQQCQQHSSKASSLLQLQQKQREQQQHWTAPQAAPESAGAAAVSTFLPVKQRHQPEAQKQEEDDDEVVLISDSDDEQSAQQQQQQEEEDYGTEQPSLAHRQLANGHNEQYDADDYYESDVETDEEQAEESEVSEGSDEEAAAEAAAGIGALELGWLAPAGPWAPTQQEQHRFQTVVHSGPMTKVLVMHPKANIELTRELLQCMRQGQWLNDEVMNFYMALLQDRDAQLLGQPGVPSCHFFNTFFVNKLIKDAGVYKYQNVQKWTLPKRLKLSSQVRDCVLKCDRVIIPVHEGVHWTCAMVDLEHKRLLFFDSLQGKNKVVMDALRRWVQDEAKDKLKQDWDVGSWPEHYPSAIPRQTNGCDCGVFTLLYASRLGLGRPFDFRQDDLLVDARVKMTCELLDIKIHSTP